MWYVFATCIIFILYMITLYVIPTYLFVIYQYSNLEIQIHTLLYFIKNLYFWIIDNNSNMIKIYEKLNKLQSILSLQWPSGLDQRNIKSVSLGTQHLFRISQCEGNSKYNLVILLNAKHIQNWLLIPQRLKLFITTIVYC